MKTIYFIFCLLIFTRVFATSSDWPVLKTPRGTELEIKIVESTNPNAPLMIIAPGQSCNSKGPLFEITEQIAIAQNINLIRFEWSYCSLNSTIHNPSDDLSNEVSDMSFVINYGKKMLNKMDDDLWLAGKSQGSMVAFQIFKNNISLRSLMLLTPVCSYSTDEQNRPLPSPLDVISENYPDIKYEQRPIEMISGDQDPLCDHEILNKFKINASLNLDIVSVKGDHGYSVMNSDNTVNQEESQQTKMSVVLQMFNWFFKKKIK